MALGYETKPSSGLLMEKTGGKKSCDAVTKGISVSVTTSGADVHKLQKSYCNIFFFLVLGIKNLPKDVGDNSDNLQYFFQAEI
jgi:hypothetical protein